MLTADLSGARRRGGALSLPRLDAVTLARAEELAAVLVEAQVGLVGATRGEVQEALNAVEVPAKERKLLLGLRKVQDDKAAYEAATERDPAELRAALFTAAARRRREARRAQDFDREAVLAAVGGDLGLAPPLLEAQLFADLKEAQRLIDAGYRTARDLVDAWRLSRVQAVLLRATRVVAHVRGAGPDEARALFARLKLLQLLFTLDEDGDHPGAYLITLDGPLSLFGQSTRYGLKLAIALRPLLAFAECSLCADVLWGPARAPLTFTWSSDEDPGLSASFVGEEAAPPRLRDEVEALVSAFEERTTPWRAQPSRALLHLPGLGLAIPDLDFVDEARGARVHFELLGFWSRDAVWRRVEMVEAGLAAPVVFAASSRLRVSEAALDDESPGCLYVFKGTLRASAVEERLERVWSAYAR